MNNNGRSSFPSQRIETQHFASPHIPPEWYVCTWERFRDYWLAGWESGRIPRPTADELARCDRWMSL